MSEADRLTVNLSDLDDVYILAKILRADDINELKALNVTALQGLLRGYIFSDECFTVKFRGKITGMFGYSGYSMPCNTAAIWFLGSDEISKHPIEFVKKGREYVEKFLEKYPVLLNIVDKRNTSHINWLKHLNMQFTDIVSVNGYDFLKFYKRKEK